MIRDEGDFEAEMDLETLLRADAIRKDSGRVERARRYAQDKADKLRETADRVLPRTQHKGFNNSVQRRK